MLSKRKIEEYAMQREARRAGERAALLVPARVHGSYGPAETKAAPKSEPYRDPVLLEMARGRPCLLRFRHVCCQMPETTVACHSNMSIHGKGWARKADDCYTVWGCMTCHGFLDFGPIDKRDRQRTFMWAHSNQVLEWRQIASDTSEPERFRNAAKRALERLGATPIGEM